MQSSATSASASGLVYIPEAEVFPVLRGGTPALDIPFYRE
jgi:hypothetical protein